MSERRYQRALARLPVVLTAADGDRWEARLRDLSLCGAFIEMPSPYPALGARVHLEFLLPESLDVTTAAGQVVRHQPAAETVGESGGIGVELQPGDPLDSDRIEAFVVGKIRILRFLKRLLEDPTVGEANIRDYLREFGLTLDGSRPSLSEQVERELRYFRIRPPRLP